MLEVERTRKKGVVVWVTVPPQAVWALTLGGVGVLVMRLLIRIEILISEIGLKANLHTTPMRAMSNLLSKMRLFTTASAILGHGTLLECRHGKLLKTE
jgi:hypothetical protein